MQPARRHGHVNPTVAQTTRHNIESILCDEDTRRAHMPRIYRWVARSAAACGTIGFLAANAAFFAVWIGVNLSPWTFDPYPFTFLLLGVSLEAIFLAILILISQNMAAVENERRHHLDLQINLLNERETTAMMRLLTQIASKTGVPAPDQQEVRSFAHDTDPSAVMDQIATAERKHAQQR